MADQTYFTHVTDIGVARITNAVLVGGAVELTHYAVGDGGGAYYRPTPQMTTLKNEVWRGNITRLEKDPQKIGHVYISAIIPAEVGGFAIREMGVFDADGNMIGIGNTAEVEKVASSSGMSSEIEMTMHLIVTNTDVLQVTVDPSVIIATKKDIEKHNVDPDAHDGMLHGHANKSILDVFTGRVTAGQKEGETLGDYATAEGYNTVASGEKSHAEGEYTFAGANASHAEGAYTGAIGPYSHAEGLGTAANGNYSHVEGTKCQAVSTACHAEGSGSRAEGQFSHAEGGTLAKGEFSHAEGNSKYIIDENNAKTWLSGIAQGHWSHVEGYNNEEGRGIAYGGACHIEGANCVAGKSTDAANMLIAAHAEGCNTTACGRSSHSEGDTTSAYGIGSHSEGINCVAGIESSNSSNMSAHAEGRNTAATGSASHAEGESTTASGPCSHAEGFHTLARSNYSHAGGYYTTALDYQYAIGKFNDPKSGTETLFSIGNGTDENNRRNAFRVTKSGAVYGTGSFNTSGADYAELFEWVDGNPDREDRRGLFVTLDGEKIRPAASADDYILGVVSANPSAIGDQQEEWSGKYLLDAYGRRVTVHKVYEDEMGTDEEGNEIVARPGYETEEWVISPDYDPEKPYIPREDRPEWTAIGLLGKLVVQDDGTCEVDGYCTAGDGGVATKAETGYRVMKRVDERHVKIMVK